MTTKTRTLKSPAERAIAALGVEQRRVEKLKTKRAGLAHDLDEVEHDLEQAERRLEYVAANPDLPEAGTDPIPGVDAS